MALMKRLWVLVKDENGVEDNINGEEEVKELRGRALEASSTYTLRSPRIKTGNSGE